MKRLLSNPLFIDIVIIVTALAFIGWDASHHARIEFYR